MVAVEPRPVSVARGREPEGRSSANRCGLAVCEVSKTSIPPLYQLTRARFGVSVGLWLVQVPADAPWQTEGLFSGIAIVATSLGCAGSETSTRRAGPKGQPAPAGAGYRSSVTTTSLRPGTGTA